MQNCSTDTGGALTGGRLEEPFVYSADLELAQFAQPEFVAAYVSGASARESTGGAATTAGDQRGGFYAVSVDSPDYEGADAAALTPDGVQKKPEPRVIISN